MMDEPCPPNPPDKAVINLSESFVLNRTQKYLLQKGLSFIPTPSTKNFRQTLRSDLTQYHRRLKLHIFFDNQNTSTSTPTPFQPKSTWEPTPESLPCDLNDLIHTDQQSIKKLAHYPERPNLSVKEREALQDLQENTSIILKPADKGSAVVIMDRTQYIQEAQRQLDDSNYYIPLTETIQDDTARQIHNILDTMTQRGLISKRQGIYLKGKNPPRRRIFYLLPKIHKSPESWPVPFKIPPGRPIVSDCDSESYNIAEFLDYYLNPLSNRHESYIKDTYDFIQKVGNQIVEVNSLIFSMDVESLYTNIETNRGLEAVKSKMKKYPDPSRPDSYILQLLHLSLTKNDFDFNGKCYLQIKGTAMGKKFAPAYADIYMSDWEESILPKCPDKPSCYFRYLDDIWGIWQHTEEDFRNFVMTLNAHHPTIKLKATTNYSTIDFLDVTTFKGPHFTATKRLDTKVFFKPTDSHALLHTASFHPRHTFRGILKSQLIRFRRICSNDEDYVRATKTLLKALRKRGYSRSLFRSVQKEILPPPQTPLTQRMENLDTIPFVTLFSSSTARAAKIVKGNFNRIMTGTQYEQFKIISAHKKNPNLKDLLVRAKLPQPREQLL